MRVKLFLFASLSFLASVTCFASQPHIQVVDCRFDSSSMRGVNASASAFSNCQGVLTQLIAPNSMGEPQGVIIHIDNAVGSDGVPYLVYTVASNASITQLKLHNKTPVVG